MLYSHMLYSHMLYSHMLYSPYCTHHAVLTHTLNDPKGQRECAGDRDAEWGWGRLPPAMVKTPVVVLKGLPYGVGKDDTDSGTVLYPISYTLHSLLYSQCRYSTTPYMLYTVLTSVLCSHCRYSSRRGESGGLD
jgi:hypothetical protein